MAANPGASIIGAPQVWPWDENTAVWEVLLSANGKEVIVDVNAANGTVLGSQVIEPLTAADVVELDVPCDNEAEGDATDQGTSDQGFVEDSQDEQEAAEANA